MVAAGIPERHRALLEQGGEADYSFTLTGVARFRGSVFRCRGALAAVYRVVADEVPSLDALGLPASAAKLAALGSGLVLTSGPVGSGKSTTMAAILDRINRTRAVHIVTVEDPVEVIHQNRRALVTQRQVGSDTNSFHAALRSVLRSDPDVVMIGEVRDRETVDAALRVSETGHLALATIHARSALHALTSVVEMFPASQHRQARIRLSASLETIYCQRLVPRADGRGRVLAVEQLAPTAAARNLIREDKLHQLFAVMDAGAGQGAVVSLNEALASLCRRGNRYPERRPRRIERTGELDRRAPVRNQRPRLAACGKTHAAFDRRSIPAEPLRFAAFCVAFRSKYTRYSSLTRLVSRAPHRPRRSPGFHHRLPGAGGQGRAARFSRRGLERRCIPTQTPPTGRTGPHHSRRSRHVVHRVRVPHAAVGETSVIFRSAGLARTSSGVIRGVSDWISLKSVSRRKIAVTVRQLGVMVGAGLPLAESLSVLQHQEENRRLRTTVEMIARDVESGSSLAMAMSRHPRIFGRLAVAMTSIGEASGRLDQSLLRLATELEKAAAVTQHVRGSCSPIPWSWAPSERSWFR